MIFGVPINKLRSVFNNLPYLHKPRSSFEQTVEHANAGKHGSYIFLKQLAKEIKNGVYDNPRIQR